MSGGLAPSKTTAYVSNLPFSLTNNDLHKIFEKYGKVVKVTIMKDRQTHKSKGVAFILFLERDATLKCVQELNNTEMFGRTLKCTLAKDNGRAQDYIRRKVYKDKSQCYECGEDGHLSYACPHNLLGEREPPKKKEKKLKGTKAGEQDESGSESGEDARLDSLASAIKDQQQKQQHQYDQRLATSSYAGQSSSQDDLLPSPSYSGIVFVPAEIDDEPKKKKYKKDAYFSDEEELDDN